MFWCFYMTFILGPAGSWLITLAYIVFNKFSQNIIYFDMWTPLPLQVLLVYFINQYLSSLFSFCHLRYACIPQINPPLCHAINLFPVSPSHVYFRYVPFEVITHTSVQVSVGRYYRIFAWYPFFGTYIHFPHKNLCTNKQKKAGTYKLYLSVDLFRVFSGGWYNILGETQIIARNITGKGVPVNLLFFENSTVFINTFL